ncbi:hypothetical protein ACLOJK_017723 [Asimina triloba]
MVGKSFSCEFTSPVSASRLFKASVLDITNLAPKISPEAVASASILQGDGGVGSIKQFKFTDAIPYSRVNERVDVLDKEKLELKYTVTDGADVGTKLASVVYHVKFVPAANGGCTCKLNAEFHPNAGVQYPEEAVNAAKEGVLGMYKSVEAYLVKDHAAYA